MQGVLNKDPIKNRAQLQTVLALEKLFMQINFGSEEVPDYSIDKTLILLNDIKGSVLSHDETKLLKVLFKDESLLGHLMS
ncbi:hypothetical protein [Cognatitamlana onchidii]|uniref:hypothetical protein n=1 Tax=Cognatitamlana onchidii TaxID=2562860 RepID=UPI0010A62229|nr:hypothetical protein [Algibacter onchidii]